HNLGEFYTPPELTRQMIAETYQFGAVTLDPACGSGTFLVELQAHILASDHSLNDKVVALGNIFGFDVSPLAILVSKANIMLGIASLAEYNTPLNVYLCDFLFPDIESLDQNAQEIPHLRDPPEVDLLIGNPPWLVLNGIASITYKQQVKDLARDLGIMMGGKHATHTELVALFFYQGAKCYVKEGGRVFFVATAGLLSGDQHSKFRQFVGFRNPFAWIFDQDVFRIHSICLGVEKGFQALPDRVKVAVIPFKVTAENGGVVFEKGPGVTYIPYNLQEIHSDTDLVKRLIPQDEVLRILPPGKSGYYDQFFQGASFVPRQFLFIDIIDSGAEFVSIRPNTSLQQKPPWDFLPYREAQVEAEYVFDVAKSLDLVPFKLLKTTPAFLPIERESLAYFPEDLKPLAKAHFNLLETLYQKHHKQGASITHLWERINYNKGVTNFLQAGKIKVIFPGSGGMVKAAIVQGDVLVDTSCYYLSTDDIEEAYYLTGILNSPSISRDLQQRGATGAGGGLRHMHKKPLEYPIPRYDESNPLHKNICELAQKCEIKVHELVSRLKNQEDPVLGTRSIQNRIFQSLKDLLEFLDARVVNLIAGTGRLLPQGTSKYQKLFLNGAALYPRNLLFVTTLRKKKGVTIVQPNQYLMQKAPWDFFPFEEARVEPEYLFQVAKSTELVPFRLLATNSAFLPVSRDDMQFHLELLAPLARAHFAQLCDEYANHAKKDASITDLWEAINYNNKLANPHQLQKLKVIYAASGSLVKAAVVNEEVIVDTTCYYFTPASRDEAYFLAGILNSQSISHDIQKKGATGAGGGLRHVHKKVLEYSIPEFNEQVPLHQRIAEQARLMEEKVNLLIEAENLVPLRPHRLQNKIFLDLGEDFRALDALVLTLITQSPFGGGPENDRGR
ncbi:MAG TPA: N-6 DNA methylase, partial [Candidatus Lokiarchaeia archaeon]|nr:N-6 DNA methylase [Candidatus Lokiarchaeia archaeon]